MQAPSVCLEEEGTLSFRDVVKIGACPYPTSPTKIQTIAGSSGFWSTLEVKVSDTYFDSLIKIVTIVISKLFKRFLTPFLHVFLPETTS